MRSIEDIRHANLLELIGRFATLQAFADKIERSHSQVSQLKNRSSHSKSGAPRNMDSQLARLIEHKLGLPDNWMDADHAGMWPLPLVDAARYYALTPADQAYCQGAFMQAITEREGYRGGSVSTGAGRAAPTLHSPRKQYGT